MIKKIQILFILLFFSFCSLIGILTLDNNVTKSEIENRNLTTFPDLQLKQIKDEAYLDQITNAFNDQLQYRGYFVKNYFNLLNKVGKQNYLGTTIIGKENYLFREPEIILDWDEYEKELIQYAELINKKANKVCKSHPGLKFIYINYPRKDIAMPKYLPEKYPYNINIYKKSLSTVKKHLSDKVILIDAYEVFKNSGLLNKCYYRSDHHVNEIGQQAIYAEVMKVIKQEHSHVPIYTLDKYYMEKQNFVGVRSPIIGF